MKHALEFEIESQPNDSSCGPTCLAAVYRYWDESTSITVSSLIDEIGQLTHGGTLAVQLGCHGLKSGFDAVITTYNLQVFDPTWFGTDDGIGDNTHLSEKLRCQLQIKRSRPDVDQLRLQTATDFYLQFLSLGGRIQMCPLNESLIVASLTQDVPILCGLSATYLYRESRERWQPMDVAGRTSIPDDVGGDPTGHFVVLHGYDPKTKKVLIADPLPHAGTKSNKYEASLSRVVSAIMLGIVTFDANLLTLVPRL
ncbi:cysteine peptidase family C39 domain-containing protein [Stieleria varia]|uniref:Peptidase C39-like domain-containing protein n=1 Tax=Stieleria varia TaxID=2528005 RepID=A0A5C6A3N5_9BACT|nr:hypothetical protein [Stieleria varia]TWT94000.1 hypothetical protein Pla52n_58290 [Stieleria varia]